MDKIDLGITRQGDDAAMMTSAPEDGLKPEYPSLYISGVAGMPELPESGQAVIEFKTIAQGWRESGGKKCANVELQILSLAPKGKKAKPAESSMSKDEEAVEKGLSAEEKKK
jgi:hypothetical protein